MTCSFEINEHTRRVVSISNDIFRFAPATTSVLCRQVEEVLKTKLFFNTAVELCHRRIQKEALKDLM